MGFDRVCARIQPRNWARNQTRVQAGSRHDLRKGSGRLEKCLNNIWERFGMSLSKV